MGVQEEIREIEEEIRKTPYNKATQGHIGRLKAKLARLKESSSKKGGGAGLGYAVKKTGDATVILLGFPSVGKSTILNNLTNAESKVAAYEFTTLKVIPGVLGYQGARIQILDIPGIIEFAAEGKGRGREVLSVARSADLLLIILAGPPKEISRQKGIIEKELYAGGFRINQNPPDVKITKKNEGGIRVESTRKLEFSRETAIQVLQEFRINNAEVLIREKISLDQLIDSLSRNRMYVPAIFVANKADVHPCKERGFVCMSALEKQGIEELKQAIWKSLELKRIYLKKPGKPPDMREPLILRGRVSVRKVYEKLRFQKGFKFAKIWGPTSRFPGQKVGLEQELQDQDILEVHD